LKHWISAEAPAIEQVGLGTGLTLSEQRWETIFEAAWNGGIWIICSPSTLRE